MRSAAARAASRRGSSIRMRPSVTPASSMASGTTVVFPAPGGACKTARASRRSAAISGSKASWMGKWVMGDLSTSRWGASSGWLPSLSALQVCFAVAGCHVDLIRAPDRAGAPVADRQGRGFQLGQFFGRVAANAIICA